MCVCVCVCVCEREREREREKMIFIVDECAVYVYLPYPSATYKMWHKYIF